MPRKSKQKYMTYSRDSLLDAVKAVREGVYSYGKASQVFNVPKTTIIDYAAGRSNSLTKSGRNPVIPIEMENKIAEKVVNAANKGFGLTKRQLLLKVGQLVQKSKLASPFKNGIPGDDWWRCFKSRHPEIVIRKPEKLSTSRSRMMNKVVVKNYFDELGKILGENPSLSENTIWNMDETSKGFEHNPTNVIARKGSRAVPGRTSDSRENMTILATVNGAGKAMPPLCIVKGKTSKSLQSFCTIDAPEGTVWTYQQKAWMNDILGELWFRQVFLANCGDAQPQLLILDSHRSHEVLGLLEVAQQQNVIILSLPPHCTHWLQPLDRSVFGPFSKTYDRACTEFLSQHPNNNINKQTWPRILKTAWEKAFIPENITIGFQATGIFPFNPQAIPDSAYAPSDALEVPLQLKSNITSTPDQTVSVHAKTVTISSQVSSIVEASPTVANDLFLSDLRPMSYSDLFDNLGDSEQNDNVKNAVLEVSDVEVPSLDDVPMLLMALGSECTVLSEVSDSELNISATSTVWNNEVESIFGTPQACTSTKSKPRALKSHRILTSDDVINEKREMKANKDKLEELKIQRKLIREQKLANKKLKKRLNIDIL